MKNRKKVVLKRQEDFVEIGFSFPYFLVDITGVNGMEYENTTEDNFFLDGTTVKSSKQNPRLIEITVSIKGNYTANRDRLYTLLPNGINGTLYFYDENGSVRLIDYKVESMDFPAMGKLREGTISLLCEYPFFRDAAQTHYDMATWEGGLEFDLDLDEGEKNELETRVAEQIKTISNPSNVVIPLTITFRASGDVTNPKLVNMTTGEKLQIDTSMVMGDEIVIYTRRGVSQKIIKNGKAANNLWHFGSSWLNLPIGDSVFRYDADSGLDYLDVEIETNTLYRGA